ncbi:MAG: hypothetical protein KA165_03585 [Saprospiraceae bacterium]|nr:hypothetical protein [Saprospiraceae bacterium]
MSNSGGPKWIARIVPLRSRQAPPGVHYPTGFAEYKAGTSLKGNITQIGIIDNKYVVTFYKNGKPLQEFRYDDKFAACAKMILETFESIRT